MSTPAPSPKTIISLYWRTYLCTTAFALTFFASVIFLATQEYYIVSACLGFLCIIFLYFGIRASAQYKRATKDLSSEEKKSMETHHTYAMRLPVKYYLLGTFFSFLIGGLLAMSFQPLPIPLAYLFTTIIAAFLIYKKIFFKYPRLYFVLPFIGITIGTIIDSATYSKYYTKQLLKWREEQRLNLNSAVKTEPNTNAHKHFG